MIQIHTICILWEREEGEREDRKVGERKKRERKKKVEGMGRETEREGDPAVISLFLFPFGCDLVPPKFLRYSCT